MHAFPVPIIPSQLCAASVRNELERLGLKLGNVTAEVDADGIHLVHGRHELAFEFVALKVVREYRIPLVILIGVFTSLEAECAFFGFPDFRLVFPAQSFSFDDERHPFSALVPAVDSLHHLLRTQALPGRIL